MTQIVAAEFDDFAAADAAVDALRGQGFPSSHLTKLFLSPEGGDTLADPGSPDSASGAVKGAVLGSATGLALGLAAVPVVGPIAAVAAAAGGVAAGAATGSLAGAVSEDEATEATQGDAPTARPSGVVVAVNVATSEERERASSIFWRHRAHSIELAEGTWNNGTWQDFNPHSLRRRAAPAP